MTLSDACRRWLLWTARDAMCQALGAQSPSAPPRPTDRTLDAPTRAFVSWHLGPALVGCIGTLETSRALEATVRHFSVQAGMHDPRTPPVGLEQLPHMSCEISVLSESRPLPATGLVEIEQSLVPGRDGVILRLQHRRAVFLPVVWDKLPQPRAFLQALCNKGGFDPDLHGASLRAEVFTAELLDERHLPPEAAAGHAASG